MLAFSQGDIRLKSNSGSGKGGGARGDKPYAASGTSSKWYQGWELTDDEREVYRQRSRASQEARNQALAGNGGEPQHPINVPKFDPAMLMPRRRRNGLSALSLFSGGGGLDLGFDLAGFKHFASYEILDFAADTLRRNRPRWRIFGGDDGDVTQVDWSKYKGEVDLIHGGPPCQPFSTAGRQAGKRDVRDMFPEFVRAVLALEPRAFLAENVQGLASAKFQPHLKKTVFDPLSKKYTVKTFKVSAASFGVPQKRTRLIFVGFRDKQDADRYREPSPTHHWHQVDSARSKKSNQMELVSPDSPLNACMGVREALGLPDIGHDLLSPTIRSTLTGPRHTTSILSSTNARDMWEHLEIWPNGVALNRERASQFAAKNGHFRLSVPDCATVLGFPETWTFEEPVYRALGQIGNSVAPPMAYWLARSLAAAMR